MKMTKTYCLLFVVNFLTLSVVTIDPCVLLAQNAYSQGKTVDTGENLIVWGNPLSGKSRIKLEITFTPLKTRPTNQSFIPKTANAWSPSTTTKWQKNFDNTKEQAYFHLTLAPNNFKQYPTRFAGAFEAPQGEGNGSAENLWTATGVLQLEGSPHSFLRITTTNRPDVKSGLTINGEPEANCINEPIKFPFKPSAGTIVYDVYKAAVKRMSAEYKRMTKQSKNTPAFVHTVREIEILIGTSGSIEENLPCEYMEDGKHPEPRCNDMSRAKMHVKFDGNITRIMYYPEWKESGSARAEAKTQWDDFVKDTLIDHEDEHNKQFELLIKKLREIEAREYTVERCGISGDVLNYNELADMIYAEAQTAYAEYDQYKVTNIDTDEEYGRIDDIAKELKEKTK